MLAAAASKFTGFGSSLMTFQPASDQRLDAWAASTALSTSGAQASGTSAYSGPLPPAAWKACTRAASGSVANSPSPSSAASRAAAGPPAATGMSGRVSGRSKTRASSSCRCFPSNDW